MAIIGFDSEPQLSKQDVTLFSLNELEVLNSNIMNFEKCFTRIYFRLCGDGSDH